MLTVLGKNLDRRYCNLDGRASFLETKEHTLQLIISNNGQRDNLLGTSLIENWKRQIKQWLSKMGGDKGMKDYLHAFTSVLTLKINLNYG